MATSILAILDDIAVLMDDVAIATKVATKKAAGILGDDLAVNAEKATGFLSSRELPVLWRITKGSMINKIIIVPAALLLNHFLPQLIVYILIAGGLFLAYEGMHKILEYLGKRKRRTAADVIQEAEEMAELSEDAKVKSAVSTDFILSIEIVIIALGAVNTQPLNIQILAVSAVAFIATVGVYGLVALIVRMDDAGYKLIQKSGGEGFGATLGTALVKSLPVIIRILSVVGTIALLLVSGGLFRHNIEYLHHFLPQLPTIIGDLILGAVLGTVTFVIVSIGSKLLPKKA